MGGTCSAAQDKPFRIRDNYPRVPDYDAWIRSNLAASAR